MTNNFIEVPTWDSGFWTVTQFSTREEFIEFVKPLFKEPGKYEFDETTLLFNAEARKYDSNQPYCSFVEGSLDFRRYWDDQKLKCRRGAIFKNNGKTWYLTREYYMWINFLPINDKMKKKFAFPSVWDTQYHMSLYELLAELHYKHVGILKKRQIASSYYHAAKLINQIWFEETPILKMGSSLKDKINEKGTWKFLDEYRSFLNSKTAWYRPMTPNKVMMWQQQIEETINGRPEMIGGKGTLQGVTFDKDASAGVGGACTIFFYEEAGIAPTMDITMEFLLPALQMGEVTTGTFIAAGSVGELDKCKPLEHIIKYPEVNSIYAIETNLLDDKGTIGMSGLFIPEQWSMPPHIDQWGNSLVEEALEALDIQFAKWKKELTPEKYQYRISQRPRNIAEAFAFRKISKFPPHLLAAQKRRIEDKDYAYEYVELERNAEGIPEIKNTNKLPIKEWPITKNTEDKTGCIVMWERPDPGAEWGTYYASIDPVAEGKTTTSESLCSIYIYKNPVEVTRIDKAGGVQTYIEKDKIVAAWCGRFDDITKTHERLSMMLEIYNAWAIIENNISLFISYMISKKRQRYLVPKNQIVFLKDIGSNQNVYQDYGWKNTGTLFKAHLLSYLIEFLQEELDTETKEDGTIVKITYGIERIPDIMAIVEMEGYGDGKDVNVDRLVALAALIAFAKIQQANRGYRKRLDNHSDKNLQKSDNLFKLGVQSPFKHIGMGNTKPGSRPPRSGFKNLR